MIEKNVKLKVGLRGKA